MSKEHTYLVDRTGGVVFGRATLLDLFAAVAYATTSDPIYAGDDAAKQAYDIAEALVAESTRRHATILEECQREAEKARTS